VVASSSIPLATNFLDHTKTRMQSRPAAGSSAAPYSPLYTTSARRMLVEEGFMALYATGLPASLLREASTQVFRFGSYPLVRDVISRAFGGSGGGESSASAKLAAGLLGGAASGVAACPFDLMRIRVQAEGGQVAAQTGLLRTGLRAGLAPRATGFFSTIRLLVREGEGVFALWRGVGVNAVRAAVLNAGTVPVYEHTKHLAKRHLGARDAAPLHLGAGLVAGLVGTTVAAPADVVRTRIMGAPPGSAPLQVFLSVFRESGRYSPRGFLAGWWPAYMRLGPVLVFYPAIVEQVRVRLFGLGTLT
jgi:hypothetical protein